MAVILKLNWVIAIVFQIPVTMPCEPERHSNDMKLLKYLSHDITSILCHFYMFWLNKDGCNIYLIFQFDGF